MYCNLVFDCNLIILPNYVQIIAEKMKIIACTFRLIITFYNEDVGNVNL